MSKRVILDQSKQHKEEMAAWDHVGNSARLPLSWKPVDDWSILKDPYVEIYRSGMVADRGLVDDVMADGSVLWLMQDGATGRRLIESQSGVHILLHNT